MELLEDKPQFYRMKRVLCLILGYHEYEAENDRLWEIFLQDYDKGEVPQDDWETEWNKRRMDLAGVKKDIENLKHYFGDIKKEDIIDSSVRNSFKQKNWR